MGFSVKQSRVVCLSRIDECVQSTNDLIDFYSRVVKAESKVSNALWKTVQYSKLRKSVAPKNDALDILSADNEKLDHPTLNKNNPEAAGFGHGENCLSLASKAKELLQRFVDINESRAEVSACRAAFHKRVTLTQLLLISESLQRFRTLYMDRDTTLESYSNRLEADVRECWKKYAKYADNVSRLRLRLSTQFEKVTTNKQRAVEASLNELENATLKLHTAHNAYTLSLSIARRYNKWLVHSVRPCLFRNLIRCLRLFDFAIASLLRLATIETGPTDTDLLSEASSSDLLGPTDLSNDIDVVRTNEEAFRRAFPFDDDLIARSGDVALQPDSIIVNELTINHVQNVFKTHLQEALTQKNMTTIFEDEHSDLIKSLDQWISDIRSRRQACDLPSLLRTDESMTAYLQYQESWPNADQTTHHNSWPTELSENRKFIASAMNPINLCTLAISLSTCEFFLCQSACFADIHGRIVRILREAHVTPPSTPVNGTKHFLTSSTNQELKTLNADLLDSRFHCLRVQIDEQEKSISPENHEMLIRTMSDSDIDEASMSSPSPFSFLQSSTFTESPRNESLLSVRDDRRGQSSAPHNHLPSEAKPFADSSQHLEIVDAQLMEKVDGKENLFQSRLLPKEKNFSPTTQSPEPVFDLLNPKSSLLEFNRPIYTDKVSISSPPPDLRENVQHNPTEDRLSSERDGVDINKEPWFHGVLPRTEVVRLLQSQGDFLVRETSKATSTSNPHHNRSRHRDSSLSSLWSSSRFCQSTDDLSSSWPEKTIVTKMVLSVYWDGYKHFIIQGGDDDRSSLTGNAGWSLEDYAFPTIRDLLEYHMRTGKPVTAGSGAQLLNPISRPDWQLENSDVKLLEKIGQGNFGEVHKGIYNGRMVAVKTCRANASEVDVRRKFLQGEATALNFCHPNIVQLIGIALRTHPIMIVMEYVSGGSLLSFLRNFGSTESVVVLLRMSLDAAKGMAYLESKNCIHRDLAARNCLLTDEKVLKIADFGMAREEHVYELNDRNGPIPVKWTAPEALFSNRYTTKCDVWSFGVLLWEMFTAGDTPYRGLSNSETRDLVESGYRLSTPDRMPRQLGKQMHNCWHPNPVRRPSFANLVVALAKLVDENEGHTSASVVTTQIANISLSSAGEVGSSSSRALIPAKKKSRHRKRVSSSGDSDSRTSSRLPRLKPFNIQRLKSSADRS